MNYVPALSFKAGNFFSVIIKNQHVSRYHAQIRSIKGSFVVMDLESTVGTSVNGEKVKQAFLALDPNKPAHRLVIKALDKKYDGFAATSDQEYDVVRELIKPFK